MQDVTDLLENVRGGFAGKDGGYCSVDPKVNFANGRATACGGTDGGYCSNDARVNQANGRSDICGSPVDTSVPSPVPATPSLSIPMS